jgi:hypothetical protein
MSDKISATLLPSQSILGGEFTENPALDNERNRHISVILNYYTNLVLADFPRNSEVTKELPRNSEVSTELDRSTKFLELPEVKKYKPFEYKNHFDKVQSWIGHIIAINETTFLAKIEDANESSGTFEDAEFSIDDIEEEDKKLLLIGSIFYWSVGYEYRRGTKNKQSILRFKRLPKIDVATMDKAADLASELRNINWD